MTNYPESGIKLVADTLDYTSAMDYAIFQADYLDSYGQINIDVSADVGEAVSAIEDLPLSDETVDYTVDVSQTGDDLSDLPMGDESSDYTVDVSQTGDDLSDLPLSDENVNFTVNEKHESGGQPVSDSNPDALSMLTQIRNIGVIQTVWNVAGSALDFLKAFEKFSVEPMLELDDAVAKVNAQTANGIPNAKKLIKDIYYDDLGTSVSQVADLVIKAKQIGAPIDEATRSTLAFTKVFKDQDPSTVLDTLSQMVKNKLAPNFKDAGDMLTTAFQNGGNRSGDFLSAVDKNATAFHDMGFDGKTALGLITQGLDAGFESANKVADSITKIKSNVQNAAGNDTSDVTKTLKMLGISNPADTGKAWSADFVTGVIQGIQNAPVSDSEKQKMLGNILGDKFTGKEFSAFMKLSPEDAANVFANMKGAADTAADDVDNSLHGAIDKFTLAAQEAVENWLSSSAVDLPGKIDKLKSGLQDGLDVLAQGGDLSDALTVALKPIGFDTAFQGLESALGNFMIAIMQAVAIAQDVAGDSKGAAGTRGAIASQGATQLGFDLIIANPDEVAGDIETAVSRGVTPDKIASTVGDAVNALIEKGQPKMAQALLDAVNKAQTDANANVQLTSSGSPLNVVPNITPEGMADLQKQVDQANANAGQSFLVQQQNAVIDATNTVKPGVDALKDSATKTYGPVQQTADSTAKFGTNAGKAVVSVQNVAGATDMVHDSAAAAVNPLLNMSSAIDEIATSANDLKAAASHVADVQGQLNGNTVADPGKHAAGGSFIGTGIVGEAGPEIVSSDTGLAVLNNATVERLMSAMNSYIPGGSFGGKGNVTNTIINQNNIPNIATADALGYKQAETLRGMSGG